MIVVNWNLGMPVFCAGSGGYWILLCCGRVLFKWSLLSPQMLSIDGGTNEEGVR